VKKLFLILNCLLLEFCLEAHTNINDSIPFKQKVLLKYLGLAAPSALIGFGIIGLESHKIKDLNLSTKNELNEHIDNKITIDDFSQYSNFISVFALNALNIKGKNNFKDRSIILVTSYLIMGSTVNIIKMTGNEIRPDGSSNNSFPSGHTATAFMGAEFLFQEYKDVSLWYGIAGYAIAAGTGFFRMYNDRHWLTDISAGAGIGILSTKIAYLIHPLINRALFRNSKKINGILLPSYSDGKLGFGLSMTF